MNPHITLKELEPLIHILRSEIAEYGALSCLLDEQQNLIFYRDTQGLLAIHKNISDQLGVNNTLKKERKKALANLSFFLDGEKTVDHLLNQCPLHLSDLIKNLVDVLINIVQKTKEKNIRNNVYLKEALLETNTFIKKFMPASTCTVYDKNGSLHRQKQKKIYQN